MLKNRHFLTLKDFSPEEIRELLDLSRTLKQKKKGGIRDEALRGKNIVQIFEKSSTRTRCAFEVAAFDEGAHTSVLTNSHLGEKESLEDSARVLCRYYDGIMFRGYKQSTIEELAKNSRVPVWNALTDEYHPTQALADILTIQEHVPKPLPEVKLVYVGDARNNVATSLMIIATKLGMDFVALGPTELHPEETLLSEMRALATQTGARIAVGSDIPSAVRGADVLYTDVWVSMGEEEEYARRIELLSPYRVTMDMLRASANPDIIFLHCLPAIHDLNTEMARKVEADFGIREMEVSDEAFRSSHSRVFDEAENRLHTIKAVMRATLT